jgi:AraC-like DNA-binding protein
LSPLGHTVCGFRTFRIESAIAYVCANYGEPNLTLAQLSRELGISRQHFGRLFREATGGFSDFLREQKMGAAAKLLPKSLAAIKQLANDVGYSSVAYFTRDFQRVHGVAPGQYRKM